MQAGSISNSDTDGGDSYRIETSIDIDQYYDIEKLNLLRNIKDDSFENVCLQPTSEQIQCQVQNQQENEEDEIKSDGQWNEITPYLALLVAGFAFSGMHVFTKSALNYIPPQAIAFFRVSLALLPLYLMAQFRETAPKYPTKAHFTHIILGFLGVGCAQSLVFVGNYLAGPDIVSVMQPTIPIYVSLYSMLLKLEKFSWWKILGQALAIAGCLILAQIDHIDFGNQVAIGTIIMVLQTMSYAGFLIIMNWHLKQFLYPLTAFFRASFWGWVCMGAVFLATSPQVAWGQLPWWVWVSVVYSGIVVSFMAHSLVTWAVAKVQAVIPALSTCLQPVLTSFMAWVFLGDILRARDIVAMIAIIMGLFLVVWAKFKESRPNSEDQNDQLQQPISKRQVFQERIMQMVQFNGMNNQRYVQMQNEEFDNQENSEDRVP